MANDRQQLNTDIAPHLLCCPVMLLSRSCRKVWGLHTQNHILYGLEQSKHWSYPPGPTNEWETEAQVSLLYGTTALIDINQKHSFGQKKSLFSEPFLVPLLPYYCSCSVISSMTCCGSSSFLRSLPFVPLQQFKQASVKGGLLFSVWRLPVIT